MNLKTQQINKVLVSNLIEVVTNLLINFRANNQKEYVDAISQQYKFVVSVWSLPTLLEIKPCFYWTALQVRNVFASYNFLRKFELP